MKTKFAQIGIFIVISVILIFSLFFIFFIDIDKEIILQEEDNLNLKENLDYCFESAYYFSLYNIAYHGGYYNSEQKINNDPSRLLNFTNRTYYFYLMNNNSIIPTLEDLEYSFERGISKNFEDCVLDIDNLSLDFDSSEMKIEVDFKEDYSIRVEGYTNILSLQGDLKKSYNNFVYVDSYSDFIEMYRLAKEISKIQQKYIPNSCLSCLLDIREKYNFEIFVEDLVSSTTTTSIYTITSNEEDFRDIKIFNFAHINSIEVQQ